MIRSRGAARPVMAVVAGASLAMLAGCAGAKARPVADGADTARPASSSSPSAGSTTRPTAPPTPTLPPGYRWRPVEPAHVTFAAPRSWSAIKTGGSFGSSMASSPQVKQMAERMGITVEQLSQYVGQIDLFLIGPPVKGYAPNLQGDLTQLAELPSYEAVTAQLEKSAEDKPSLRYFDTPAGKAMDATYTIQVGTLAVHCRSVWVDTEAGVVNVTLAGNTATSTAAIGDVVEDTIHAT